ncbi:MAG: hypothetical protein ACXITR_06520 [Cyanobacterium sp.]
MKPQENNTITDVLLIIEKLKSQLIWKPQKAEIHLKKRIARKHVHSTCTIDEYESIILSIINKPEAQLYVYQDNNWIYPTIVSRYKNRLWLAMCNMEGIMETAFPPDNPDSYFGKLSFKYLGIVKDLKQ